VPVEFIAVEDVAEAERIASQERRSCSEAWKEIADAFVGSGERFVRFNPASDERLIKSGENGETVALTAGAVASSLNSYAKNRNLPLKANTTGEGLVQLSRVEREGEPREPGKPGRKSRATG
jgi:hypothetical protein